ncbi:MAG: TIGR03620 family F420-dependent LLM class oxidoreductase [Acidimicrobiales bacterium]
MAKIELGSLGAAVAADRGDALVDTAVELEELGYATIWLTGGPLDNLRQIADVVRATERARVAAGVLSVDRFPSDDVAALYAELEAAHPGRFVVGLGGAHGPNPLATLNAYLDRLDSRSPTVPQAARVMAALGPRMLDLARDRAAGALPVLVTTDYVARARARLGADTTLAVEQLVVLASTPQRARQLARRPLGFLGRLPGYQRSFRRMGFADDEIQRLVDRLVDAVVAWGDADSVAARLAEHRDAGADHVAVSVVTDSGRQPIAEWRDLATRLAGT